MSYLDATDPKFLQDLLSRHEFYSLKVPVGESSLETNNSSTSIHGDPINEAIELNVDRYLQLHSHQLFVRNFMNPNTQYRTLIVKFMTGTGKTITAIASALEFIKLYKLKYQSIIMKTGISKQSHMLAANETPSVIVLGFNPDVFITTLIENPQFGFTTPQENDNLMQLRKIADMGIPTDIKQYKDYISLLKRNVTNKSRGGFFKFYGYQMFVNRLFSSDSVNLTTLETLFKRRLVSKGKQNDESSGNKFEEIQDYETLEEMINDYIRLGKIKVNQAFLDSLKDSFIICDEFHNMYNMNMKNNYGIAVQYVLDTHKTCRALFMSATPINNLPTEIVDIMDLVLPKEKRIKKKDLFKNKRELHPGKLELIGKLLTGHVSYLQDNNPEYFPVRKYVGTEIKLSPRISDYSHIPYLKFIQCEMSPLHYNTYKEFLDTGKIPIDSMALENMVFPNPKSTKVGLYKSLGVRNDINNAPESFRRKHGIRIVKQKSINLITGEFLEKKSIKKYSEQYYRLISDVDNITSSNKEINTAGKILIYHHRVRVTGVVLIQELLRYNGYINYEEDPSDETKCSVCGIIKSKHKSKSSHHDYNPARYAVLHSDVDKSAITHIIRRYNSPGNSNGHNIKILVGSKMIKESYDIKDVQHMMIMSFPTNIPTLIQILGRGFRKNSHINLDPKLRNINVSIYISTHYSIDKRNSIFVTKYMEKLLDYMTIQDIEKEMNRYAVDGPIHRNIIFSEYKLSDYGLTKDNPNAIATSNKTGKPLRILGDLYFERNNAFNESKLLSADGTVNKKALTSGTYVAYGYFKEEIDRIIVLIKRSFMKQPIWTYDDLLHSIRNDYIKNVNSRLFNEDSYIIAINHLTNDSLVIEKPESTFLRKLFDTNDKYIYKGSTKYKITDIGKYFVLFQTNENGEIFRDIEGFARSDVFQSDLRISVEGFTSEIKSEFNYESRRRSLIKSLDNESIEDFDFKSFMIRFNLQFYNTLYKEIVEYKIAMKTFQNRPVSKVVIELYDIIIENTKNLEIFVYSDEVKRYKNILKLFKKYPGVPKGTPIGVIGKDAVMLYNGKSWFDVSKVALNHAIDYKENSVIVGYFDDNPASDGMRFKLRKPLQASSGIVDTRLIEKGIVCKTKHKDELESIAKKIGAKYTGTKVRHICEGILDRLITLEKRERAKDSRVKYLYVLNETY